MAYITMFFWFIISQYEGPIIIRGYNPKKKHWDVSEKTKHRKPFDIKPFGISTPYFKKHMSMLFVLNGVVLMDSTGF